MDRDHLARILGERDGEVFAACRRAVMGGAPFWVAEMGMPAPNLVRIYARRDRHTQRRGTPAVGFSDAVAELRAQGEEPLLIGAVDVDEPPYYFQFFLDEHAATVVACLGVDQSRNASRRGTEPTTTNATGPDHPYPSSRASGSREASHQATADRNG